MWEKKGESQSILKLEWYIMITRKVILFFSNVQTLHKMLPKAHICWHYVDKDDL